MTIINEISKFLEICSIVEGGKMWQFESIEKFVNFCNDRSWSIFNFDAKAPRVSVSWETAINHAAKQIIRNAVITATTIHVPIVEVVVNEYGNYAVVEYQDTWTPNFGFGKAGLCLEFRDCSYPLADEKIILPKRMVESIQKKFKTKTHRGWVTLSISVKSKASCDALNSLFEEFGAKKPY